MSLKDLLPPGAYDEITKEAHVSPSQVLTVSCPYCHKKIPYSTSNPWRPFCSEKCKLLDLGAWAEEENCIPGRAVNEDVDADLLNDPRLPKRHLPSEK